MDAANYSAYSGYAHLGAGLTVGMSSLAAGLAIGIVGDAGVRANAQQPRLFVGAPGVKQVVPQKGTFEDDFLFPKVSYVSSLEATC